MLCREFEKRLQEVVDLRRDPSDDAELDGHAALCADCSAKREWFSTLARMSAAFGASSGVPAAAYDRRRLIREAVDRTRVEDDQLVAPAPAAEPPRRRSRLLLAGSGLAVAAGVALFVTLAFLPWAPAEPVGPTAQALPLPNDPVSAEVAVVASPAPANAAAALAAPVRSEQALSLERLRASLTSLPSDPPVTGSLRPIATSFGVAWEAVRSALPQGRSEIEPTQDQADARGSSLPVVA